jgi:hypothetical protein
MGFQGDFHIIGTIQCGCLVELGGVFFAGFNPQRAKVKSNFSEWRLDLPWLMKFEDSFNIFIGDDHNPLGSNF